MRSPTEVSALVPTNACRHGKLLDKHAVRDDQPLRTVVDVRTAIGHCDVRGVNGASSERDHAMHRTCVTAVLCCVQFLSPDGNKHPTDTSLPPPHESRQNTIWTPQPTARRKRRPLDRILFSSQKRGALLSLLYYLEIGMSVMAREKSRHKADQVP